jgi:hypothetical protein
MGFSHLFLISLIIATLFLSHSLSSSRPKSCVRLTRAKIQEKYGKPVKCPKDSKDEECFGPELEPVKVQFNSSDVVTRLEIITHCRGIEALRTVLDELVPKSGRGKYRQQSQRTSPTSSCQKTSEEEYECLRIRYFQEMCTGCAPASIKVIWKDELGAAE